jgi:hypothetical protein
MYAYCWYEQKNGAFKFGVAQVPAERMVSYAVEFDLRPDPSSLQVVDIPQGEAVHIHTRIMHIFIDGLGLKPVDGFNELFHLRNYTYNEIKQLFGIVVCDIVMFIGQSDGRKARRMRELAEDRVREWKDINNGGSS